MSIDDIKRRIHDVTSNPVQSFLAMTPCDLVWIGLAINRQAPCGTPAWFLTIPGLRDSIIRSDYCVSKNEQFRLISHFERELSVMIRLFYYGAEVAEDVPSEEIALEDAICWICDLVTDDRVVYRLRMACKSIYGSDRPYIRWTFKYMLLVGWIFAQLESKDRIPVSVGQFMTIAVKLGIVSRVNHSNSDAIRGYIHTMELLNQTKHPTWDEDANRGGLILNDRCKKFYFQENVKQLE